MNHNHNNYQTRLDFVNSLLRERFNIENAVISTVEYDSNCPFKYNNFIYRTTLSTPVDGHAVEASKQPGCVPIPQGTTELILRLTNGDAEGLNHRNRIENEVGIISLVSDALGHIIPKVVPSVYGWGSAANASQGWILQELMPGTMADAIFHSMELDKKRGILAQMAQMLSALQKYQLPPSITGLGGLTFDDVGRVISASMTTVDAGPWPSYEEFFEGRLKAALLTAHKNKFIQGWYANGVRRRLDKFIKNALATQFQSLSSKQDKTIVHMDFTTNNLLLDPTSQRVTALLDYDFACIAHPSFEFLCSFHDVGGMLSGWSGNDNPEEQALRDAQLHGFPSLLSESKDVDWQLTKAWDEELEKAHVRRPREIDGIDKVADVEALISAILPFRVANPDKVRLQSEEVTLKSRNNGEQVLIKMLDHVGF